MAMSKAQRESLQRDLNRYVKRYRTLDDIEPLTVDGDLGPSSRDRVRDVKFWIGYEHNRDAKVTDDFRWRLDHPRRVRDGHEAADRELVKRGDQRRRRHARRADDDDEWGGCRGVTNEIIRIVRRRRPGTRITSRKRSETFGNPGSDHHVSQRHADAVDFARVNDHALADQVARDLGGPSNVADFQHFNVKRRGRTFRVQLIAGTHGTGPHLHSGVRRA